MAVVVRPENELFSEKQILSFFPQHQILMNRLRYCLASRGYPLSNLADKAVGLDYESSADRAARHVGCDRASDREERWYPTAKCIADLPREGCHVT